MYRIRSSGFLGDVSGRVPLQTSKFNYRSIPMPLNEDFVFRPLPALKEAIHFPFPGLLNPLGPLAQLVGTWGGKGFNTIWRPNFNAPGAHPTSDHFLELNLTEDQIAFTAIPGQIPNRGLLQKDINMFGITYLQQTSDSNLQAGLHIEPGIWAVVPATTAPQEVSTIVRMASIPHGTTVLAQGTASTHAGPPSIPVINLNGGVPPGQTQGGGITFLEQTLATPSPFRSSGVQMNGITQAMVTNPNSVLTAALAGQTILSTTTLHVSTHPTAPITGGGTSNTSFLTGSTAPNAVSSVMESTFWLETVQGINGAPNHLQLQYSQIVILTFAGITWPHVSVATLRQNVPVTVPVWKVDPDIPAATLPKLPFDPVTGVFLREPPHLVATPIPTPIPPGPVEVKLPTLGVTPPTEKP
jgi:hypothetical protein